MRTESATPDTFNKPQASFAPVWSGLRFDPRLILALFAAVAIGITVGEGKWPYTLVLVAVGCILMWPVQMSLGMFALTVPFDFIPLTGGKSGLALTFIVGAGATGILLVEGLVKRRFQMPSRSAMWWFLFISWATITAAWAVDPDTVMRRLPTAWAIIVLYLVAVSFRVTKKEFHAVAIMAIIGGCIAAGYAARGFYQGAAYQSHDRASLVLGDNSLDPNYFAASLLLPLSLGIAALLSSKTWMKRLGFLSAVFLISYALLLSMSRGALVAVFLMIIVYARRLRLKRALLAIVPVLAIAAVLVPEKFYTRLEQASTTRGSRLDIWMVGWAAAKHYGIIGAGLSNFSLVYDKFMGAGKVFRGASFNPHNIYVEMVVELGLVGILLFAGATITQLREANGSYSGGKAAPTDLSRYLVACEAACFGTLACSFFLGLLWFKTFWLSWIFLAIMVRLMRTAKLDAQTAV